MITENDEMREKLLRSPSFLSWSPEPESSKPPKIRLGRGVSFVYKGKRYTNLAPAAERHYTIAEIAKQWGISTDLARDTFRNEAGVLKFDRPGTRVKRGYSTLRVPESVMVRVHTRLTSGK
jgi:hypothetical protein